MPEDGERAARGEHAVERAAEPARVEHDLADFSDDERSLAELLGRLTEDTGPRADERARMRERVLAGLPDRPPTRTAATSSKQPKLLRPPRTRAGRTSRPPRGPRADDDRQTPGRRRSSARGRFAVAVVAVLCLVLALGGMSLLLSRDALPGDALYGVKRTAEAASLGLTFGDEQKAYKHLEFATSRVGEMEALAQRYDPQDAPAGDYLAALTDFDTDATAGSRLLIALTTQQDGGQLGTLAGWAREQASRLGAIVPRLPAAALGHAATSQQLAAAIADRADTLAARLPCGQITSGDADDIGALPATAPCRASTPTTPPVSSVPASPGSSGASTAPPRTNAPTGSSVPGGNPVPTVRPTTLPNPPTVLPPTVPVPPTSGVPTTTPPVQLPLPIPPITLGPVLPGVPAVHIGTG